MGQGGFGLVSKAKKSTNKDASGCIKLADDNDDLD